MLSFKDSWRYGPLYLLALSVAVSVSAGGIATGLVFLAAAAGLLSRTEPVLWPQRSVVLALGALVGCYFLATLLAMPYPHNWHKFSEELWIKFLLLAIPTLAGRNPKHIEGALKLSLTIGAVAAAYAVVQHFIGFDPIRDRSIFRPQFGHAAVSGFFSHHLSYAGQAMIFLILATAWWLDRPTVRKCLVTLPILVVMGAALLWSFARSSLLGAMAGLLVLILVQQGRRRWFSLAGILGAMSVVFLIAPVRVHFLNIFQMDRHLTRLNLWQSSWEGIKANPLLGFGPGNFESLLAEHQVQGHYETLGHAHNDLLMHGANAGVPGVLAALALLGVICWLMIGAARVQIRYRWIFTGTLAIQVGITVAGFFQVYQTDDEVEMLLYFVLGCAVALVGLDKPSAGPPEPGI